MTTEQSAAVPTGPRLAAVLVALALVGETVATWLSVEHGLSRNAHWTALTMTVAFFALAAAAVRRLPARWASVTVLVGCVVLAAAALHTPPNSSQDWLRYAWDGRIQLHGIDPYRFAPNAQQLAELRPGFVRARPSCAVAQPALSCFRIDRAAVHTIYPPVAQLVFAMVETVAGRTARPRPFQLTGALAVLGVTVLLLRRRTPSPAAGAALWAWCPLVIIQYGNNAHIDAVAVGFAVLGLTTAARAAGRRSRDGLAAGAWVGAGIATKVFPVLAIPALLARPRLSARNAGVVLGALAVVLLGYLPHVLAVGPGVLGYLPGYLHEEGYTDGERFHLLAWFITGPRASLVAVGVLAVVAVVAAVRADPLHPERSALLLVGAFLAVTTPTYPWYGGLLVAVAALADRPRWIALALAAVPTYGASSLGLSINEAGRIFYTAALLIVLVVPAARQVSGRLRRPLR